MKTGRSIPVSFERSVEDTYAYHQMVLEFPVLAEYALLDLDGQTVFATHGHVFNPSDPPMLKEGDILLNGHTHVPACEVKDGYIYMNPGSVSIPKESSEHSCMIYEEGGFKWKDLQGRVYGEWAPGIGSRS